MGGKQTSDIPFSIVDDNNQIAWLLGFYAQDEWHPTQKLTINFGLRWDWMSAFVTQNQWSPRIAIEYALTHSTILHAGYARYFKVPPFDQVALKTVQKFKSTTNAAPIDSGNDKIEAETDDYFDVGIRQRVLDGLNVGVDGFYKFGHDQLDLAQLAGSVVTAPLNYRESRGWGSDFSLTFERGGLSAYLEFFVRGSASTAYKRGGVSRRRCSTRLITSRIIGSRSTTIRCSSGRAARLTSCGDFC